MKVKLFITAVLTYCAFMCAQTANAQTDPIKVKFKVDGKEVDRPFRIEISLKGFVLEPEIGGDGFIFPPELVNQEKVDLRFISGKYNLPFEDIPVQSFKDGLIFGVDNKPFAEEHLSSELPPDKELALVYYLMVGTGQLTVHVYK